MKNLEIRKLRERERERGNEQESKKAFTLIELIVVIVILTILGTIAFIAFQGFSADARDTKRLTDTRNLYSKITIENSKGVELEDLLIFEKANGITVNGESKTSRQGTVNFETLKENSKNFKDPTTGGDYIFGYAEDKITRNGEQEFYSFVQLATISEKENTTKLVGNYFQYDENTDSKSILSDDEGIILENNNSPLAYEINGELGCSEFPNYVVIANIDSTKTNKGTPTKINQSWQNKNPNGACYYSCSGKYSSKFCDKEEKSSVTDCTVAGELFYLANSRYGNCDTNDILLCNGEKEGTIFSSCNAGTNIAGTGTLSYGNLFQWGNNHPFPNSGDIVKSPTKADNANDYGPGNYYSSSTYIYSEGETGDGSHDWAEPQNHNLWGDATDTPFGTNIKARQGPCLAGYHVPAVGEFEIITSNITGGYLEISEELKIPLAGFRSRGSGSVTSLGIYGLYWSSSSYYNAFYKIYTSRLLYLKDEQELIPAQFRVLGASIRCFKN